MSEIVLNITDEDIARAKRMRNEHVDPKTACPIAISASRQLGSECFTTPYKLHFRGLTRRLPVRAMDLMDRFDCSHFVRAQRIVFP